MGDGVMQAGVWRPALGRRGASAGGCGAVTHYRLTDGTEVEILCWLDDHSRYALSVTAHTRITGSIVLTAFRAAVAAHGAPASTLTDNGMVHYPALRRKRWPQRLRN